MEVIFWRDNFNLNMKINFLKDNLKFFKTILIETIF